MESREEESKQTRRLVKERNQGCSNAAEVEVKVKKIYLVHTSVD
jgi:hypothetical protein